MTVGYTETELCGCGLFNTHNIQMSTGDTPSEDYMWYCMRHQSGNGHNVCWCFVVDKVILKHVMKNV